MAKKLADLSVEHHGSMFTFKPQTPKGKKWLKTMVQTEPWQWLGENLAVDHHFARDLAQAAIDDGLEVN